MKRNIEIKKKLEFPSMIGEIIAISLENHLRFIDDENIEGYLDKQGIRLDNDEIEEICQVFDVNRNDHINYIECYL